MPTQAKRYSGRTVEVAVKSAMDDLGDDAEILSARRVRRGGVAGFFASEHVEVSARRVARSAQLQTASMTIDLSDRAIGRAQAIAFEEHLQQMVRAVEEEEAPVAMAPPAATAAASAAAPVVPAAAPAAPMAHRLTDADLAPLPPAPPPAPAPAVAAAAPRVVEADYEPDERPARRAPRKPASHRRGPQWSVSNLRRLGVAEEVLRRLVAPQPASDTAWTMALERAISDALPTGESRDRIAMHGYGAESAVTLLASALRGHRVDYIHLRERTAPASVLELALAIRSCLCQ